MGNKKVLIGMSGGVDSSVAAYLMKEAGFDCLGATMRLTPEAANTSDDSIHARSVADTLGIPFHILDYRREFAEFVIGDFIRCYESGLTPNPCIVCNQMLKFGCMLQAAFELGCEVPLQVQAKEHQASSLRLPCGYPSQ